MADGNAVIRPLDQPGDLGWVVMAHGELYASQYGWDSTFEASVAQIVADYGSSHDAEREAAWIAEMDGTRIGSVVVISAGGTAARLRVLLVHPDAQGRGIGRQLLDTAIAFSRAKGYDGLVLWTNDVLRAAIHLYLKAGFVLADEHPHHSYGVDLIGQTYQLDLQQPLLTGLRSLSP